MKLFVFNNNNIKQYLVLIARADYTNYCKTTDWPKTYSDEMYVASLNLIMNRFNTSLKIIVDQSAR